MDARQAWQALQARLTNARAALDAGDRMGALAEIGAALEIDPQFLAAHSLRDRILAVPDVAPSTAGARPPAARPEPRAASLPLPSADVYARFEQRAKRRRVDRRLASAAAALENGEWQAAATALDEIIELEPNLPQLPELTARLDALRRKSAGTHRGPRLAAAAVFVAALLGASLLHDSTSLTSRPMIAAAAPVTVPMPGVVVTPDAADAATTGIETVLVPAPAIPLVTPEPPNATFVVTSAVASPPREISEMVAPPLPVVPVPVPVPVPPPDRGVQQSLAVAAVSTPVPPVVAPPADDNRLVEQALQRYRIAYEGLDAQSAKAVWPAVNQVALARAFDGLESQSLTFDACDVRVSGESATATCQGSARYVPKIGSRGPRVEPRVWNFALHKTGGDWKIESAHAQR